MGSDLELPEAATLLLPYLDSTPATPLRAGIVLDSSSPPNWVRSLIRFLAEDAGTDLQVLVLPDTPSTTAQPQPGWLMDRLYTASRRVFDPFTQSALSTTQERASRVGTVNELPAHGCDVLIWLARETHADVDLRQASRYGAFTVRLGNGETTIPFWEEVSSADPVTSTTVFWHERSLQSGRPIRIAETSTEPGLYFTLTASGPLAAVLRITAFLCIQLRHQPERTLAAFREIPEHPVTPAGSPTYPSSVAAARFIAAKLKRSAYGRWTSRGGSHPEWFLAIRPNTGESIAGEDTLAGFTALPLPPGARMAADPFLWEHAGKTWLLFEFIPVNESRGRLGCVELLADGTQSEMQVLLDRQYHLSYPCVVPSNGELFLLPESADARQVQLYRFTNFPAQVELVSLLVEGLEFVDTTPVLLDGIWYFFTTTGLPFMETLLFWSDRLDGPWRLHPHSPVSSSVTNSRSAGNLFWKDGRLFRPTQDCSVRYGYAMTVNEVSRLTPTEFEERPVTWVPPSWMPGLLGTHTWNESSRWQVVDGLR